MAMSTVDLVTVFREMFTAPLKAAVEAEKDYRRIWADWLEVQKKLLPNTPDAVIPKELLFLAPVLDLNGVVEVGVTMRIAGVNKKDIALGGGISVGPIHVTGTFGFSSQNTQESVFQAHARFTLSNCKADLSNFLTVHNLTLAKVADLDVAIKKLNT
jgi:hypothetical protein